MKLVRYVMAELTPRVSAMAKWHMELPSGVTVYIKEIQNADEVPLDHPSTPGPTLMMASPEDSQTIVLLTAQASTSVKFLDPVTLDFEEDARLAAEDALRYFGASLAVQSQNPCRLWSPKTYLALLGEDERDREILAVARRIRLPHWQTFFPMAGPGLAWPQDFMKAIPDRHDGVILLGAAITANHGVGKLHELFRLFENAFKTGGTDLVDPLSEFLASHPQDLGYSHAEVAGWVRDLRDPAIHADLKRQPKFASDHDVQGHMLRVEQAAYDVLFNKETWHTRDARRQDRNTLRCAITADGRRLQSDGGRLRMFSGWDLHNAFPMRGQLSIPEDAEMPEWGFLQARWHFSESEREEMRTLGAKERFGSDGAHEGPIQIRASKPPS